MIRSVIGMPMSLWGIDMSHHGEGARFPIIEGSESVSLKLSRQGGPLRLFPGGAGRLCLPKMQIPTQSGNSPQSTLRSQIRDILSDLCGGRKGDSHLTKLMNLIWAVLLLVILGCQGPQVDGPLR